MRFAVILSLLAIDHSDLAIGTHRLSTEGERKGKKTPKRRMSHNHCPKQNKQEKRKPI